MVRRHDAGMRHVLGVVLVHERDGMKRALLLLACVSAALFFAAPTFAGTISTVGSWNGSDAVNRWGADWTPTYGQTIRGNGQALTSWTFYMDVDPAEVFRGAIYTWDGQKAVSQVFLGGDMSAPAGSGFRAVTFDVPGGVTLAAGQEYVLLATTVFSTQDPSFSDSGNAIWGGITTGADPGVYADGEYVYTNDSDPADLTTVDWDGNHGYSSGQDLAFTAQFKAAATDATRIVVCTTSPVQRADGTRGIFADLEYGAWLQDRSDATSPYYRSSPAIYVQGYGEMCSLSDVASYGGDPAAFAGTGTTVDELGEATGEEGALYQYYARK
jgi:hypothetical protein